SRADDGAHLRPIRAILLPLPLLPPAQRALAEWLADHYASPLSAVARLFLPAGLARGIRSVLRPSEEASAETPATAPGDAAYILGLRRERGKLERRQPEAALGHRRAQPAMNHLLAEDRVTLSTELPSGQAQPRRQRSVRLIGSSADLDTWRIAARARLD